MTKKKDLKKYYALDLSKNLQVYYHILKLVVDFFFHLCSILHSSNQFL